MPVDFRHRFGALVAVDRQPIRAQAPTVRGDETNAVLRLYDPIDSYGGPWGISAREFAEVLDEIGTDVEQITLLINCPGGEVWEGLAILNVLRRHPARVVAIVEGIAASAASFIAAGCDELVMAPNSELFVHRSWGLCVGNAVDMAKLGDELEREDRNLASIYAAKSGGTVEKWLEIMEAETWYFGQEAVDAGLADRVDTDIDEAAADKAKARHDLSIFNTARRRQVPQASAPPPSPRPEPGQEGGPIVDLTELRDALGLAEDTSDDDIVAAARDRLTAPPPDPTPAPLPEGVVAIDAAQLEQLRNDATAGVEARNEQLRQHRAAVVDEAVRDGRIAPARRDHWVAALEADPGAEQVLANLAKGTIPVEAIGSAGSADLDTDEKLYADLYGKEATV